MTTSQWPDGTLGSREIYSGDIDGLRAAVIRLESALDGWSVSTFSDHLLSPISDQADSTLHRRIYDSGVLRGWVESPAPVIRRNGVIVEPSEYTLHAVDGFIVFHAQQAVNAAITVSGSHTVQPLLGLERFPTPQNIKPANAFYSPAITAAPHVNVTLPANTQILLPYVNHRNINISRCAIHIATGVSGSIWAGIYSDNGSGYPQNRMWRSSALSTASAGPFLLPDAAGSANATLLPGILWFMLHSNVAVSLRGIPVEALAAIGYDSDLGPAPFVGYLRGATAGEAPVTFPTGAGLHRVLGAGAAVPTLYMRRQ